VPKMKWGITGKGVPPAKPGGLGYDGPDLPKGSWPAKIKRMEITRIQSTSSGNQGKPRIRILLEVQTANLKGKEEFHGCPVWDGLNIIDSSQGFVNTFLHALTDGSQRARNAIESVFWDEDKGPDYRRVENKRGEKEEHIIKIGRVAINSPEGETMVQITTRPGVDNNGNYRPEITGYYPYQTQTLEVVESQEDSDDDDDDMLEDEEDEEYEEDEEEDYDDEDEEDISEEQDAKETAKSGSRRKPPF